MTAMTKAIAIIFLSMRMRTELDVLKRGVGEDTIQLLLLRRCFFSFFTIISFFSFIVI